MKKGKKMKAKKIQARVLALLAFFLVSSSLTEFSNIAPQFLSRAREKTGTIDDRGTDGREYVAGLCVVVLVFARQNCWYLLERGERTGETENVSRDKSRDVKGGGKE